MPSDFRQVDWDATVEEDCRRLVRLAIREDLDRFYDCTTLALVPPEASAKATVVAREAAVVAGMPAIPLIIDEMQANLQWTPLVEEGSHVTAGVRIAEISGSARDLLTSERIVLNLLGRLCGVATRTRRFVDAVTGTQTKVYDTRKTTPGWRLLEKYAVHLGGGRNHRRGLYDAVLVKDNHLALWRAEDSAASPAKAVERAREFVRRTAMETAGGPPVIEIEVDTLDQLNDVLQAEPDVVLLDNMSPEILRKAVEMRNASAPGVVLEASGGVDLDSIGGVAATGVDRISVGGLTHAARSVDLGLDWL